MVVQEGGAKSGENGWLGLGIRDFIQRMCDTAQSHVRLEKDKVVFKQISTLIS